VFDRPPREVLALVEGLPDNRMFAAYVAGGSRWNEFYGWGRDRHMVADQWDLHVAINTPKGKKVGKYPRPASKAQPQEGTPFMSMIPRLKA